jgi:hypothetical protein
LVFTVGIVQDRVADPVVAEAANTSILKGAKDVVALPSLALMMMLPVVPTLLLVGVPEISPVLWLKLAQLGKPLAENVAVPPVAETVGWNT